MPSVFSAIATNGPGPVTWDAEDVKRAICPDHVASLLREWKVPITGKRSSKGWLECHAIDREDTAASAGINLANGTYKDQGGEKLTCSIFDLAIRMRAFPDFPSAVNALGQRFGVLPKGGNLGTLGEPSTPKAEKTSHAEIETMPVALRSVGEPSSEPDPKCTFSTLDDARAKLAKRLGTPTGTWNYGPGFAMVRFDKADEKSYRPFHEDATTKLWGPNDPPGLLPLYRLEKLRADGAVWVFEGEKCADLAVGLGINATTSSHGSSSAGRSDWSALAGREVVIVPDLDTAGARYTSDLVEILRRLQPAPSVRVLELPGLVRTAKDGADIEQWLEGLPDTWEPNQIREELWSLASRAPDSTQPTRVELGLVSFAEIEVEPIDWLWPERILRGSFTLLAGEGEIGKSFLTLDLIARISTGRPFPDQAEVTLEPSHCIFVTAEDRLGMTIKPRLLALGADCSKVHTIGTGRDPKGKPLPFTIADIGRLDKIMAVQPGIVMIVIDPIAAFLGRVDENKNAELRSLLGPLSDFADRHNVTVIGNRSRAILCP